MPTSAAHGRFLLPTSGPHGSAFLIRARVGDDMRPAAPLSLARAPAVEHRGRVPCERMGQVAPNAKAIHLQRAAAVEGRCNRVADDDRAEHGTAIEDTCPEPPGRRRPAMPMVSGHEITGRRERHVAYSQLPIEHQPATAIIGQSPKRLTHDFIRADPTQQGSRPFPVLRHLGNHCFVQMFAARLDHELVAAPYLEQPDPLRFAAEQANGRIGGRRERVHAPRRRRVGFGTSPVTNARRLSPQFRLRPIICGGQTKPFPPHQVQANGGPIASRRGQELNKIGGGGVAPANGIERRCETRCGDRPYVDDPGFPAPAGGLSAGQPNRCGLIHATAHEDCRQALMKSFPGKMRR